MQMTDEANYIWCRLMCNYKEEQFKAGLIYIAAVSYFRLLRVCRLETFSISVSQGQAIISARRLYDFTDAVCDTDYGSPENKIVPIKSIILLQK